MLLLEFADDGEEAVEIRRTLAVDLRFLLPEKGQSSGICCFVRVDADVYFLHGVSLWFEGYTSMLDRLRLAGAAHENSPRARLYFKTTKAEALPASAIRSGTKKYEND